MTFIIWDPRGEKSLEKSTIASEFQFVLSVTAYTYPPLHIEFVTGMSTRHNCNCNFSGNPLDVTWHRAVQYF